MPLQFIKSPDSSGGETELLQTLHSALSENNRLLWIVSGGSNISIAVRVMSKLDEDLTKNLQILLSDERLGIEGHPDSNYYQFLQAGFNKKQATFEPVLMDSLTLDQTIARYEDLLISATTWADTIIGQLGIGRDGHIAGVLPGSPVVNSRDRIVHYKASDFSRISLSLEALKQIDLAFVFCFGQNKLEALRRLSQNQEPLDQLPSLILRHIADVKVYNDQIEGAKQ